MGNSPRSSVPKFGRLISRYSKYAFIIQETISSHLIWETLECPRERQKRGVLTTDAQKKTSK